MQDNSLILHHYDFSNFSEKVRLVFALKQIGWDSVIIPSYLPKPDYLPLTGGYRRTPALQVGSDIYCDTRLIVRFLDELCPNPPLYPSGLTSSDHAKYKIIEDWAETNFMRPIALFITGMNAQRFSEKFHRDRANLHGKPIPSVEQVNLSAFKYEKQVDIYMDWLNCLLKGERDFVTGVTISLTDIVLYEGPWFLKKISGNCDFLKNRLELKHWFKRMSVLSLPPRNSFEGEYALNVALNTLPKSFCEEIDVEYRMAKGTKVKVSALGENAYSIGNLVHLNSEKICISVESKRTGLVHVHFPRQGYSVRAI